MPRKNEAAEAESDAAAQREAVRSEQRSVIEESNRREMERMENTKPYPSQEQLDAANLGAPASDMKDESGAEVVPDHRDGRLQAGAVGGIVTRDVTATGPTGGTTPSGATETGTKQSTEADKAKSNSDPK